MFTAADARKLQKESFTSKGRIIDAIREYAKNDYSEVAIPNLNLTQTHRKEFEEVGFSIIGNVISWAKPVEKEVVVKDAEPQPKS